MRKPLSRFLRRIWETNGLLLKRIAFFAVILFLELLLVRVLVDYVDRGADITDVVLLSKYAFPKTYTRETLGLWVEQFTKDSFSKTLIIWSVVFLIISKEKLKNELLSHNPWQGARTRISSTLILLNLLFLILFLPLNHYMSFNLPTVLQNKLLFSILWWFCGLGLTTSLFFAVFNPTYVRYYPEYIVSSLSSFRIKLLGASLIVFIYLRTYAFLNSLWPYLSRFVAFSVYKLIGLTYSDAVYTFSDAFALPNLPKIGVSDFTIIIFPFCSGIDGMSLFTFLFLLLVVVDWIHINKKKAIILLLMGVTGALIVNILRIYLLILGGILISPDFALQKFHNDFGWILFTTYFLAFIYLTYPWMRK